MNTDKNDASYHQWKASLLTGLVAVWFIFFALRWQWQLSIYQPDPNKEDIIEVSLGDFQEAARAGMSEPISEASPASSEAKTAAPVIPSSPKPSAPASNLSVPKSGDEKVNLPTKATPSNKPPTPSSVKPKPAQPTPIAQPKSIITPTPIEKVAPPKPKAVFSGKLAAAPSAQSQPVFSGAKKAETYGNAHSAGNGNVGNGENGGNGGMSLDKNLLGRGLVHIPVFREKFNQNGTIRVEVRVNREGRAFFSRVMRSNTADAQLMRIIKTKISEIRFRPSTASSEDEYGYIDFNFKVTQ